MHAWFSQKQMENIGYCIWLDMYNNEIIATHITTDYKQGLKNKEFLSDLIYAGEVDRFHIAYWKSNKLSFEMDYRLLYEDCVPTTLSKFYYNKII